MLSSHASAQRQARVWASSSSPPALAHGGGDRWAARRRLDDGGRRCGAEAQRRTHRPAGGSRREQRRAWARPREALENEIDRLRDELGCSARTSMSAVFSDVFSGDLPTGGLSGAELHVLLGCRLCSSAYLSSGGPARPYHPGPTTPARESDGSSPCWGRSCLRCFVAPGTGRYWSWAAPSGFRAATAQVVFGVIALHVGLVLSTPSSARHRPRRMPGPEVIGDRLVGSAREGPRRGHGDERAPFSTGHP